MFETFNKVVHGAMTAVFSVVKTLQPPDRMQVGSSHFLTEKSTVTPVQ